MGNTKIKDMASLDAEIKRLKNRVLVLEEEFSVQADDLKDNYGRMVFNSVLGNSIRNVPFLGPFLYEWAQNQQLQDLAQRYLESFSSRGGGFFRNLLAKLFGK